MATRNARPGGAPTIVTTQSPQQTNLIRIQRPQQQQQQQQQQFTSQIQSGDGSVVQVVQRPLVTGSTSTPEQQRQTVVKVLIPRFSSKEQYLVSLPPAQSKLTFSFYLQ